MDDELYTDILFNDKLKKLTSNIKLENLKHISNTLTNILTEMKKIELPDEERKSVNEMLKIAIDLENSTLRYKVQHSKPKREIRKLFEKLEIDIWEYKISQYFKRGNNLFLSKHKTELSNEEEKIVKEVIYDEILDYYLKHTIVQYIMYNKGIQLVTKEFDNTKICPKEPNNNDSIAIGSLNKSNKYKILNFIPTGKLLGLNTKQNNNNNNTNIINNEIKQNDNIININEIKDDINNDNIINTNVNNHQSNINNNMNNDNGYNQTKPNSFLEDID